MSSLPPAPALSPIDRDHLDRMTMSDRALEREVLALFRDQSALLHQRLLSESGDFPDNFAALAHTLKGSARAIGAFQVARAAEVLETSAPYDRSDALGKLGDAVADAGRAIGEILDGA